MSAGTLIFGIASMAAALSGLSLLVLFGPSAIREYLRMKAEARARKNCLALMRRKPCLRDLSPMEMMACREMCPEEWNVYLLGVRAKRQASADREARALNTWFRSQYPASQ